MVEDNDAEGWCDGYDKGKKAGIKEVVEWIKQENDKHLQVLDGSFIIAKLDADRWFAKLKEWGIDNSLKV